MIKVVKTKPMVATKIKETSTTINTQREATEQVERPVYQGGLLNAELWQQRKEHTKENWKHLTRIWINIQDMERQRINIENQDKNIQDNDTTDFSIL